MNKYRYSTTVKSYETDAFGRISLPNLLYYFQEAANLHATSLNWGLEYLESINKFWVLSRLKVKIKKYPVHKDEIEATTWPRGAEGFFAYRDYQVIMNGKSCIDAVSSWMILDKNTHRPCKINQLEKEIPVLNENYIQLPESKLSVPEQKILLFEKKVDFSDIDINLHVNNAKYIEIFLDSISARLIENAQITEIDIQYLHESQLNDMLHVSSGEPDLNQPVLNLIMENISKNKETCRCQLAFI